MATFEELAAGAKWGFWFEGGFCVLTDGSGHALPPDVTEPDEIGHRTSAALGWYLVPADGANAGGHCYFWPGGSRAVAVRRNAGGVLTAFDSWVGREFQSAFGQVAPGVFGRTGYTVQWTQGAAYAGGARHYWCVTAVPNELGLGVWPVTGSPVALPWWSGQVFKEWPTLGRGRPAGS